MYLSRIELDITKSDTMRALASPSHFHGAIERAVSDGRERKLWRIDLLRGKWYLLILTEKEEDWGILIEQFGVDDIQAEEKCYDALLERVTAKSKWRFLLRANPTIATKKGMGVDARGKVMAYITEEFQKQWLMDRAGRYGFSLNDADFLVTEQKWYSFYKGKGKDNYHVRLLAVTYEGILTVTDASLFREVLVKGIGREKAYGMGLLTILAWG